MNTSLSHIWKGKRLNISIIILYLTACSMPLKAQLSRQSTSPAPGIPVFQQASLRKSIEAQTDTGKLVLTFTDIRSKKGNILLALYINDSQWTDHPYKEYHFSKENLENGSLTIEITDLPRQKYAIALMDDEDANFEMNLFCGLPREGFGMSTNPSFFKLKKPKFDEVAFELNGPVLWTSIKLNYLNKNRKIK